ncbi:MFS transporter, partial [Candidatus Aminicenantes bacterium AH-873-B07]|nr:MFS transporter [Candidatus Aminicenantes bacterium AH-873-B07]
SQIGFFIGLFSFTSFLSRPFMGWLLDKKNPKKLFVLGNFLFLISVSLYPLIRKMNIFLAFLRIFHGFSFSMTLLAGLLIAVFLSKEEVRAYALGIISIAFMLPQLIMPMLGEYIIEYHGYLPFFALTIVLMSIAFILSFRVKFTLTREISLGEETRFLEILKRKQTIFFLPLSFLIGFGVSSCFTFVPLLKESESSLKAGFFFTFTALTAVFVRAFLGRRFRWWGKPIIITPCFTFFSISIFLLFFAKNNYFLSLSGLIFGTSLGFLYPNLMALNVEKVKVWERGKALGLFASSVDLGFALGPLFFGLLTDWIGMKISFMVYSIIILFSSLSIKYSFKSKL